ncbi:MAG: hypothetical protein WC712_00965 [Candidatus Brocadiia bacterium]
MDEIAGLLKISFLQGRRAITDTVLASPRRAAIAAVLWSLFWGLLFLLFQGGWNFLEKSDFRIIRDEIAFVSWTLFFFPLLVMIAFSNSIISFSSLFQSKETELLLTRPISDGAVFAHKMRESVGFATWATLFISLPLLMTYGMHYAKSLWFYVAAVALFCPFVLLAAAAGTLVALLVGVFLPRRRAFLVWLMVFVTGIGGWKVVEFFATGKKALSSSEQGLWLREVFDKVSFLRSDLLPSGWMAKGITSAASGVWSEYLFYLAIVGTTALFLTHLTLLLGGLLLRSARQRVESSNSAVNYNANGWFTSLLRKALFGFSAVSRETIVKDMKSFARSPGQWTQFLIFFGLLGFYVMNLRTFNYHVQNDYWKMLISTTNLAATGLVLASFTCRFVFPLISLEGNRIWVLGLAPISRKSIVMGKFWFSFLGSSAVSLLLIVSSDLLLNLDLQILIIHNVTMVLICYGLSGLSVGLGALFPNFKEENPSHIISGFGGTVNLVFSLAYVLVTVAMVGVPFQLAAHRHDGHALLILLGGMGAAALLALAAGYLPMKYGIRAFENAEF